MFSNKKFIAVLVVALFFFSNQAMALVSGQLLWEKHYGGDNFKGRPVAMAKDSKGNLFVLGSISLDDGYDHDSILIKYDSNGNQRWARRYPHLYIESDASIVIDKDNCVYISGILYSDKYHYREEVTVLKYNNNGKLVWIRKYGPDLGSSSDSAGIVIDSKDNIYAGGSINDEFALIKYDKSGKRIWARQYIDRNNYSVSANGLSIDIKDNLFISGLSISSGNENYFNTIIKYSSTGTRKWIVNTKRIRVVYFRSIFPQVKIDINGNAIVASTDQGPDGTSDYQIIKFGPDGKKKWLRWFNGGDDAVSSTATDESGNIYVTGQTRNDVGKITEEDIVTVKFDKKGNRRWARKFDGSGKNDDKAGFIFGFEDWHYDSELRDEAIGIVIGNNNSVYVAGIINAGLQRVRDMAVIKYDSRGKQRWARTHHSSKKANDVPTTISKDQLGNIYIAGFNSDIWYIIGEKGGKFTILKYAP